MASTSRRPAGRTSRCEDGGGQVARACSDSTHPFAAHERAPPGRAVPAWRRPRSAGAAATRDLGAAPAPRSARRGLVSRRDPLRPLRPASPRAIGARSLPQLDPDLHRRPAPGRPTRPTRSSLDAVGLEHAHPVQPHGGVGRAGRRGSGDVGELVARGARRRGPHQVEPRARRPTTSTPVQQPHVADVPTAHAPGRTCPSAGASSDAGRRHAGGQVVQQRLQRALAPEGVVGHQTSV